MLYKPIRVANIMKIETMTLKVGNVTRAVSSYSYDDIGRLVSVKRSGNAGIVKYDYNIRNWLKETKSDRFSQNLWYESTGAYHASMEISAVCNGRRVRTMCSVFTISPMMA